MPKIKGSGIQMWGRMLPQPALDPTPMPLKRRRQRGYGPGPHQVRFKFDPLLREEPELRAPSIFTLRDADVLREFRREMAACDNRSCVCMCHCHAGPYDCYVEEGLTSQELTRFHQRTPNTAHKCSDRHCPKGDSHKW